MVVVVVVVVVGGSWLVVGSARAISLGLIARDGVFGLRRHPRVERHALALGAIHAIPARRVSESIGCCSCTSVENGYDFSAHCRSGVDSICALMRKTGMIFQCIVGGVSTRYARCSRSYLSAKSERL